MDPIGRAVLPGRSHHDYAYILEAFLWSRAFQEREWMTRLKTIRKVGHTLKLRPKEHGLLYECATVLEKCYDANIPYVHRLRQLGDVLSRLKQLPTVDKECLMWAAAARWLSRAKASELSAMALAEYRGIGLRLSNGATDDPLAVLGDLIGRESPGERSATRNSLTPSRTAFGSLG